MIGQWGGGRADALGHLGRVDGRLRPHAHRHAVAVGHDPVRLHGLHAVVLAAHRQRRDDDERRANDTLTVKLGSTTLGTYSNLNKASGYVQRSFNVAAFAGQTVTLTFTGTENLSRQNIIPPGRRRAERELTA